MTASGLNDSTGKVQNKPVFKQGEETYETDTIRYNIKTKKGIISHGVTKQGEGFVDSRIVKKGEDAMYAQDATYTTCNLEHPHFYIKAPKIVIIPNDKIVSGPFNLYVGDVPTPLGFPLGIFPLPKKQKSGLIFPVYGESADRGFFLRNGGFYLVVNDNLHVKVLEEVYSRGGYGVNMLNDYIKRYRFSGNLDFYYNKRITNPFSAKEKVINEDFWFKWNHTSLARKSSRFSANVSLGSSSYNRYNSYNPTSYLQNNFQSAITYSKTFTGTPFNLTVTARQDQNNTTKVMNVTLPEVSVNMNRIYPFKPKEAAEAKWYHSIGTSYTFNARLTANNAPVIVNGDTLKELSPKVVNFATFPDMFNKYQAQAAARHTIPINASLKIFKYFNFNPGITYNEYWYQKRYSYHLDANNNIDIDTTYGFARASDITFSNSVSTNIYGMFKIRGVPKIRHTLIPTVAYNYNPNYAKAPFKSVDTITPLGYNSPFALSNFAGLGYGAPATVMTNGLVYNIANSLEMKVKNRDTSNTEPTKKIKLIDNLGFNGAYNFAADSFQMSNISVNARTNILQRIDINFQTFYDPYSYTLLSKDGNNVIQQRNKERLLRETSTQKKSKSYTLSIGLNLNPSNRRTFKNKTIADDQLKQSESYEFDYVDFKIPWNLFIAYNANYSKVGFAPELFTQALTFRGSVGISQKWKIEFNSGYDLKNKGFSFTQINIYRDLHCWEMRLSWIPFGLRQSYSFDINVKASVLQDLKLNRKRDWRDNNVRNR